MNSRPASLSAVPTPPPLAGHTSTLNGHTDHGTQSIIAAEGQTSPQAIQATASTGQSPAGDQHSHGHNDAGPHDGLAVAASVPSHTGRDTHGDGAGDAAGQSAATLETPPTVRALLADPLLALAADVLSDLETVRIANENRLRQLTRSVEDKDGETRGFGLDETHPDVARLAALVGMLGDAEHQATLNLQRLMRAHPLGPWLKARKGIGDKQGARLLAAIGDPYIRPEITREDGTVEPSRPRLVSELWAYAGYHVIQAPASGHIAADIQRGTATGRPDIPAGHDSHDIQMMGAHGDPGSHPSHGDRDPHSSLAGVAARRRKGQHANWSPAAKMRAYLIAESCIKQMDSPYRAVYDTTRARYADAVHAVACERCGPKGKPAQPGSPLSAGHQHARALRAVSKTILRDLWREARDIHNHTLADGR